MPGGEHPEGQQSGRDQEQQPEPQARAMARGGDRCPARSRRGGRAWLAGARWPAPVRGRGRAPGHRRWSNQRRSGGRGRCLAETEDRARGHEHGGANRGRELGGGASAGGVCGRVAEAPYGRLFNPGLLPRTDAENLSHLLWAEAMAQSGSRAQDQHLGLAGGERRQASLQASDEPAQRPRRQRLVEGAAGGSGGGAPARSTADVGLRGV